MNSRRFLSLLEALWAELPLPEWLPGAGGRVWQQAVAALLRLWQEVGQFGVVIGGPVPWWPFWMIGDPPSLEALPCRPGELAREAPWLFTPNLPPESIPAPGHTVIPLLPQDPLVEEPFLLLLTPAFAVIAVQGYHPHTRQRGMMLSFEPEVVRRAWQNLEERVQQSKPEQLAAWRELALHYPLTKPPGRVLARFSSFLLLGSLAEAGSPPARLPPARTEGESRAARPKEKSQKPPSAVGADARIPTAPSSQSSLSEAELLRALIHEIQTPLSTIRTLASLILKRQDLPPRVREYVEKIDRECTEQINRFSLFFQATETVMPPAGKGEGRRLQLEPIALVDLVRQNLPRWQDQVERRGSRLELEIPAELPDVVSDPKALEAVLFGIIDRLARSTPAGSHIRAQLLSAGELVKLQFQVNTPEGSDTSSLELKSPQAIGQLLVVQPDTGAISLSLPVAQTLFRALGGYLTVRHRARQGEILNIYLPRQL